MLQAFKNLLKRLRPEPREDGFAVVEGESAGQT